MVLQKVLLALNSRAVVDVSYFESTVRSGDRSHHNLLVKSKLSFIYVFTDYFASRSSVNLFLFFTVLLLLIHKKTKTNKK